MRKCHYCHKNVGPDAEIIAMVLGNSGPGWTAYAHPECARAHGKYPIRLPEPRSEQRGAK